MVLKKREDFSDGREKLEGSGKSGKGGKVGQIRGYSQMEQAIKDVV